MREIKGSSTLEEEEEELFIIAVALGSSVTIT
jgi:hypothetical protein